MPAHGESDRIRLPRAGELSNRRLKFRTRKSHVEQPAVLFPAQLIHRVRIQDHVFPGRYEPFPTLGTDPEPPANLLGHKDKIVERHGIHPGSTGPKGHEVNAEPRGAPLRVPRTESRQAPADSEAVGNVGGRELSSRLLGICGVRPETKTVDHRVLPLMSFDVATADRVQLRRLCIEILYSMAGRHCAGRTAQAVTF